MILMGLSRHRGWIGRLYPRQENAHTEIPSFLVILPTVCQGYNKETPISYTRRL
jgi:hypothetical protein